MSKLQIITPYNRPWAITEDKLVEMRDAFDRHQAGEKFDYEGLKAVVTQKSPRETGGQGYQVQDGVAVIDVEGILGKRMNIFMYFCGGTSTELLQNDIADALADNSVHSIVLAIDSPGGDVDGTQLAANAVKSAAAQKPVVSWISGCGCSAAYWIAAMAPKVYIADDTTQVGSIGVVMTHTDRSKADELRGVKRTEITAGKYKRIASDTGALTQEGRDYLQGGLDQLYSVFLPTVAGARGMDPEVMHDTAADGRVLIGQKAIDAGLADGVATLQQVIAQLNGDYQESLQNPGARASATQATGDTTMPDTNTTTFTQAQIDDAFARGVAQGRTEGASAELARIQGIAGLQMPGHGALIKTLMFDGKTTPEQAALQVVGAEQASLKKAGTDLEADAKDLTTNASAPDPKTESKQQVEAQNAGNKPAAVDPVAHAKAIQDRIAKAKGEGRTLSAAQADAEISAEAAAK